MLTFALLKTKEKTAMKHFGLGSMLALVGMLCISCSSSLVVLYDNDVHCAVDGYARMAGLRDSLRRAKRDVLVVSCGDFVSGSPLGAVSRGEYIVRIMNAAGYDYVALGNHECDYRIPQLLRLDSLLEARLLCCNFKETGASGTVFAPSAVYRHGRRKVAFIGVTTPSAMTSSTPAYFMDSLGNYRYTFCGSTLFETVQQQVDSLRRVGADCIVLLSHLGDEDEDVTSTELIARTHGIDVLLDAHAHHVIPARYVEDAEGHGVLLSSTGTAFSHIGRLEISRKELRTELLPAAHVSCPSQAVADTVACIREAYRAMGERPVGRSECALRMQSPEGARWARDRECSLGDFCADAFRTCLQADVAWCNGGSLRKDLKSGPLTFNDLYAVFPFGNAVCLAEVSGQDLLDALEMAVRSLPGESGGFAQVSGLRYAVDTHVVSSVRLDADGMFSHVEGERRVRNVEVMDRETGTYRPLLPEARYTLAATRYVLTDGGDGMRFPSLRLLEENAGSDVEVLERYLAETLQGVIDGRYASPHGNIRIY